MAKVPAKLQALTALTEQLCTVRDMSHTQILHILQDGMREILREALSKIDSQSADLEVALAALRQTQKELEDAKAELIDAKAEVIDLKDKLFKALNVVSSK
jgi:predicted kinase